MELDRRGRRKFRAGPRSGSAGDMENDANLSGQRGRLPARLPSTETRELADELRVGVAWNRELEDLAVGCIGTTILDGAEPRDELGDAAKSDVAVAHGQPPRHVG